MTSPSRTIVVYGGGFAAHLTAAAFSRSLGRAARLVIVASDQTAESDALYGSASAPTAHNFFESIGLDEPTLMMRTHSAFSLGTRFTNWPSGSPSWIQTYHLPFPILSGVPFQHFLTERGAALEPYLISARAAAKGVFAHPPDDPRHPLSRAEYGYQFSVSELRDFLSERNATQEIELVAERLREVQVADGRISALVLESGRQIEADLFIDCSADERALVSALGASFETVRELRASSSRQEGGQLGPAYRSLTASDHGWSAITPLQGRTETLSITHPSAQQAPTAFEFTTGKLDQAWVGNCVAIGHAAWGVEPLTPAPMMLLQRDIERALDLIPVTNDHRVEAREYNRRFEDDIAHTNAFQRALFAVENVPEDRYWQDAVAVPIDAKLQRKLTQFKSRGILVRYDLEPFNEEDWAILLNGIGIKPERYDRQVDGVDRASITQQLEGIERAVAQMVSKMPPHHVYMTNMKRYLEKQNHG